MANLSSISPAEISDGFPFTRIDAGEHITSRAFFALNAGDQLSSSSPLTINISEIESASDPVPYSLSSGELLFKYSDRIYLTYNVSFRNTNNTRSDQKFWIEKDSGSGFQLVDGSEGYVYIRTGNSNNSGSKTILLNINKGDTIRLRTELDDGSDNIVEAGLSSIVIHPTVDKSPVFLEIDAGTYTDPDDELEKTASFDAGAING